MFELRCIVRGCHELLVRRENALFCSAGHHFDQAKQGYWPLLQPQDRKSLNAGDSDTAVLARQRWLAREHTSDLNRLTRSLDEGFAQKRQPAHQELSISVVVRVRSAGRFFGQKLTDTVALTCLNERSSWRRTPGRKLPGSCQMPIVHFQLRTHPLIA